MMNREYNQIVNLYKFNVNFSKFTDNDLINMSPDYIIEKYNHWIGFTPTVEHKSYTPDHFSYFFHKYWKLWKSFREYEKDVKNILLYLKSTESLQLSIMFSKFEEYIGDFNLISGTENKRGLHTLTEGFVQELIEGNSKNMTDVLRELKLRNLIKEKNEI